MADKKNVEQECEQEEVKATNDSEDAASDVKETASEDEMAEETSEKESKKKDSRDVKIEELEDKVKRQMAEFDNFRKRNEKEKTAMYDMGVKDVIDKLLPVIDNFERGLMGIEEDTTDPIAQGMQMIYKQFTTMLDGLDVKEIPSLGETFNPDYHNAVMHVEDENCGEQEIVEVLQKGYTYHDGVVRHSMVKVAN
ncbi:molecular chaperone GrpE [Lachnospiraceae bacterium KHCPX20]|nr:molecular chaperone GrpE [Lachnospiraceae bacterium KHCPX20]